MKLFAQHGHQPSDKISRGIKENVLDGAIFSTRYSAPEDLLNKIQELRDINHKTEIYIDPEYFGLYHYDTPNKQLGNLPDWGYFTPQPRRLLRKTEFVNEVLNKTFGIISRYNPTGFIAPNIYIPKSFDSIEAVISLNFIEQTKQIFSKLKRKESVYATLAVDVNALQDIVELKEFLNEITAFDNPPDGYYILIGRGVVTESVDLINSEIINSDVIAGWMLLNYILKLNGFKIINGYSDILSVLLGAAGGTAGATGWWSKLRSFSLGNYIKSDRFGGRPPNTRYLSKKLFNRINLQEKATYSVIVADILNDLRYDKDYDDMGDPGRTIESLQTWETIKSLSAEIITDEIESNMNKLFTAVTEAGNIYARLSGLVEGFERINEYFDTLKNSIENFKEIAEL